MPSRFRLWLPLVLVALLLAAPVALVRAQAPADADAAATLPGFSGSEGATIVAVAGQVDALPTDPTFVLHQATVTDASPLVTTGDATLLLPVSGAATVTDVAGTVSDLGPGGLFVPAGAVVTVGSGAGATVAAASVSPGATARTAGALWVAAIEASATIPFTAYLARVELAPTASIAGATVGQAGIISGDADLAIDQPGQETIAFPAGRAGNTPAGARLAISNPGIAATTLFVAGIQPIHPDIVAAAPRDPAIPTNGYTIGDPNAPLLIVEYGDYQCPFCVEFHMDGFAPLLTSYIATGLVRFEFRPFSFLGQESLDAAAASQCAAQQNLFWPMHETIYANHHGENQGALSRERLDAMAALVGLDMTAYATCMDDPATAAWVQAANESARTLGVRSTPTILIGDIPVGWSNWPAFELAVKGGLAD